MGAARVVRIDTGSGEGLAVRLRADGDRWVATIFIDGIPHHLERLAAQAIVTEYCVDADPDYAPQHDSEGHCYIVTPFTSR